MFVKGGCLWSLLNHSKSLCLHGQNICAGLILEGDWPSWSISWTHFCTQAPQLQERPQEASTVHQFSHVLDNQTLIRVRHQGLLDTCPAINKCVLFLVSHQNIILSSSLLGTPDRRRGEQQHYPTSTLNPPLNLIQHSGRNPGHELEPRMGFCFVSPLSCHIENFCLLFSLPTLVFTTRELLPPSLQGSPGFMTVRLSHLLHPDFWIST